MTMQSSICLIFLTLALVSCRPKDGTTFNYTSLDYDTSRIQIFEHDTVYFSVPKYSKPIALSTKDIELADSLLNLEVTAYNRDKSGTMFRSFDGLIPIDNFVINLLEYKRQYFPYKDSNGQRILKLICFSRTFPSWRKKEFLGRQVGIEVLTLKINLSEQRLIEFYTGGYG